MMLTLIVKGDEFFDEETQEFSSGEDVKIELEHSLVALSKWESITQRPYLSSDEKTPEEIKLYIEAMITSVNHPPDIVNRLTSEDMRVILAYINSPESATTFGMMPEVRGKNVVVTSELIYYWMVAFQIPFECERWHLNRLFSLVRICNLKNSPPKKMSRQEMATRNAKLNAERRAKLGTRG